MVSRSSNEPFHPRLRDDLTCVRKRGSDLATSVPACPGLSWNRCVQGSNRIRQPAIPWGPRLPKFWLEAKNRTGAPGWHTCAKAVGGQQGNGCPQSRPASPLWQAGPEAGQAIPRIAKHNVQHTGSVTLCRVGRRTQHARSSCWTVACWSGWNPDEYFDYNSPPPIDSSFLRLPPLRLETSGEFFMTKR